MRTSALTVCRIAPAILVLIAVTAQAQQTGRRYDLLIKNGHVIDPKNSINEPRDVAVSAGKIAAVEKNIDPALATTVVNAKGLYVTPGLVDIHVHVYAGTGMKALTGDSSVYPDGFSFRACTTTMADAGTSGARNFEDFKQRVIDRSKTRVFAFINIVGLGMGGGKIEQDTADMDPKAAAEMAKKHSDVVVGFKTAHYSAPDWTAVDRVLEAGKMANLPVMIDFGIIKPERPHDELYLKKLRPGDIYTHMYRKFDPTIDDNGKVRPYLFEAKKRGVIFDVGHGAGSLIWRYAVPSMKQGFIPDSISTDLHTGSMNAGMKDIVNVMSKFMNLGMPLQEVILKSTWNPAKEIRREKFGHLTVGNVADIAVFRLERGEFGFLDSDGFTMKGTQRLSCEMTLLDGKVMFDQNGRAGEAWEKAASQVKK
ncbi:MAG TPA: amidohydrolase/deacetylase family metallohydrolase [Blastocatellia bacterium]|nr:amidohydrolase/deacetylase family metallohydrolase [Blastocatellia bacterium]HMV87317.1 amidohydrolase/deacetylase family metallohydrolase [Blastocatellia bacterium]HMX27029.1 amidohydrolase/deacetylase family metallohydrolase [Blastocatellia bacterium]HMY76566.1 amidohydrolase/deacetylase family metallohydrolase [Blastocatellia bacterium]HMZ21444.1 amidohydrolase/deacetylase family metallohydrolase [Blastocatellia bacterium]